MHNVESVETKSFSCLVHTTTSISNVTVHLSRLISDNTSCISISSNDGNRKLRSSKLWTRTGLSISLSVLLRSLEYFSGTSTSSSDLTHYLHLNTTRLSSITPSLRSKCAHFWHSQPTSQLESKSLRGVTTEKYRVLTIPRNICHYSKLKDGASSIILQNNMPHVSKTASFPLPDVVFRIKPRRSPVSTFYDPEGIKFHELQQLSRRGRNPEVSTAPFLEWRLLQDHPRVYGEQYSESSSQKERSYCESCWIADGYCLCKSYYDIAIEVIVADGDYDAKVKMLEGSYSREVENDQKFCESETKAGTVTQCSRFAGPWIVSK